MLKEEFEQLAMRGHGTITGGLYDAIEKITVEKTKTTIALGEKIPEYVNVFIRTVTLK